MLVPQLVGDVGRRDRAEERAGRAGFDVKAELHFPETLRNRLGVLEGLRFVPRSPLVDLLQLRDARGRRLVGEAAGKEEVPCVTPRDVHDLAAQADLVDVLAEDDFHLVPVPLPVMLSSFWVAGTKPAAALVRSQGWQPW